MVESENPHPRLSSHLHRPDPVSGSIPAHTGHNASHPKTTLQIEQLPREINQGSSPQKAFPWFFLFEKQDKFCHPWVQKCSVLP